MTARAAALVELPPDFALQPFVREGGWQPPHIGYVGESPSIQDEFRNRQALALRGSQGVNREVEGAVVEEGVAGVGWWRSGSWKVAKY